MVEAAIFDFIKTLSYPAVIGLFLFFLNRSGIFELMADFLRSKINGNTDPTTNERLDLITNNHLHEVVDILKRIESKVEKMSDDVIYLKARSNGKY